MEKMSSALEEPMLSRLTRLDNILKQLEEMTRSESHPPKSSYSSTTSSGALTSEGGHTSSLDASPKRLDNKHCRSVEEVMLEVERKGTLIDRLARAEDRILKMEAEFEAERRNWPTEKKMGSPKKGLKQYVQSCVPRKKKHKN